MARIVNESICTLTAEIEVDTSQLDEALAKAKELEAVLNRINLRKPVLDLLDCKGLEMMAKQVAKELDKALDKAFSLDNG